MLLKMAAIASWHERPGLNPYELGSNRASHSGSSANLTSACKARSFAAGPAYVGVRPPLDP